MVTELPMIVATRPLLEETWQGLAALGRLELVGAEALVNGHPLLAVAQVLVTLPNDEVAAAGLDRLDRAVLVANHAVGVNNIDIDAASSRGIYVSNTPDVLTEATADFAFALLLAAARRLGEGERLLRAGRFQGWAVDFMLGQEVHGKTLGIVGMGRIGRAVARRAKGFGMQILHNDLEQAQGGQGAGVAEQGLGQLGRPLPLEELLRRSDYVSLHVPLGPETHHLINEERLALMKPSAVLVNTSRGPVVDEAALARALASGGIAAAGLDVFEREPEVHPDLLGLENAVLAPHLGSATRETRLAMGALVIESVQACLRGQRPGLSVNAPPAPRLDSLL